MKTAVVLSMLFAATGTFATPVPQPNPDNLDILIFGSENTLVRPENPALVLRDIYEKKGRSFNPLTKRFCGGSGENVQWQVGDNGYYCANYCENSLTQVTGDPVKSSDDIDCTTDTCGEAHAYSNTITSSFTVNIGISSKEEEDTFNAGASWTWSDSVGTTNTYTFNPTSGDIGYIVFKPYYEQSCGQFTTFEVYCNSDNTDCHCTDNNTGEDDNACGKTPKKLDSGEADGIYSFCHTDTGYGC